jgi:VanZ family protein
MGERPQRLADHPAAAWLAVALWTGVILFLSGEGFSARTTSGVLAGLAAWLLPGASPEALAALHFLVRKSAHVVAYGVLGALAFRALRHSATAGRSVALGLALVGAVAVADESHQARLPNRTGSARDVALDLSGGALGISLVAARWRRRARGATGAAP